MRKEEVMEKRKEPCYMCGDVSEEGNHIIGYDHTDVDDILSKYYEDGTVLCRDCLFK